MKSFRKIGEKKIQRRGGKSSSHRPLKKGPPLILLGEDDEEMRKILSLTLRKEGYEVVEAKNGLELAEMMEDAHLSSVSSSPDLIISDIRMPGVTGLSCLAGLRAFDQATPVLLITAFGDLHIYQEAARLGATDVMDKPFEMEELRKRVLELVPPF
jgi:DNA-binding response OmpR family regulator